MTYQVMGRGQKLQDFRDSSFDPAACSAFPSSARWGSGGGGWSPGCAHGLDAFLSSSMTCDARRFPISPARYEAKSILLRFAIGAVMSSG